ncbi:MAG TPA: hypothetical protein VJQ47_11330 [Steroidobacteraceae bacterium]|nr:hypothetical protein [Steroidobacteraceae bacterium]
MPRPQLTDYAAAIPLPDRWRIMDSLGYRNNLLDPYNRNVLKADKPVFGDDGFFNLGLISDSRFESRELPTAVGGSSTRFPGENDIFGRSRQEVFSQSLATEFVLFKGDTVFRPPDYELRFTPVFNFNHASIGEVMGLNVDPRTGRTRSDHHIGIQEAFVDAHIRNVSDRFDFDSVRFGIQPFSSDFRGFLFQDDQLGARLFGTRDNNRMQYNIAWFRLLEKDTNSGLNDLGQRLRDDDVFVFNLYRQDLPVTGFTSQVTVLYNRDREAGDVHYDSNGFLVRPAPLGLEKGRNFDVVYLGYNGDGHFGRLNLTASAYYAVGTENRSTFEDRHTRISAFFAASELSADFNWVRTRLSFLYASGDRNPYDDKDTGFDAVFDNPQFAGSDTSYFVHEAVPLVGGGGVALSGVNSLLNSLRSSKDEGQSNFTNPGTVLAGVGADFDVLPTLRVTLNANDVYFANTAVVEAARNQGSISKHVGEDLSASLIYRPLDSQNIVIRASYARMIAGDALKALFPRQDPDYVLFNLLLAY